MRREEKERRRGGERERGEKERRRGKGEREDTLLKDQKSKGLEAL